MDFTAKSDLDAWYKFNGNANDELGNYNGTVTNASLDTDAWGRSNSAYDFDGTGDLIDLNINNAFDLDSIDVYFYVGSAYTGDDTSNFMIGLTGSEIGGNDGFVNLGNATSSITGETFNFAPLNEVSDQPVYATYEHFGIGWNIGTIEWDGSTYQVKVNNSDGTDIVRGTGNTKLTDFDPVLGGRASFSQYFTGKIQEVKIRKNILRPALRDWLYRTRNIRKAI